MSFPPLLFDLDGTLVDTAPDLLGAVNAVLVGEGRPTIDPQSLRQMVGQGARVLIERAMAATGESISPELLPALVNRFIAHYREHIADDSRPFPGVVETLGQLRDAGAPLAVLTNKPQVLTVPILEALQLSHFFDVICGSGRYGYNKPDARIVAHVLDEMGGVPGSAIMIGDSAVDVATARAADIPVVLVSYGYTPQPARDLSADAVVDSFPDVIVALRNLIPLFPHVVHRF